MPFNALKQAARHVSSPEIHMHVKETWGQNEGHGSVWESVKHLYAFHTTSLLINTQQAEHMATTRLSRAHTTGCSWERKKHNEGPESQTRKRIYRVCVFSGGAAAFHFSSVLCPLRGLGLSGPPTNSGLHTRQVHHIASERMNTLLSNAFQMNAGILESAYLNDGPLTCITWPRRCHLHEVYAHVDIKAKLNE